MVDALLPQLGEEPSKRPRGDGVEAISHAGLIENNLDRKPRDDPRRKNVPVGAY